MCMSLKPKQNFKSLFLILLLHDLVDKYLVFITYVLSHLTQTIISIILNWKIDKMPPITWKTRLP